MLNINLLLWGMDHRTPTKVYPISNLKDDAIKNVNMNYMHGGLTFFLSCLPQTIDRNPVCHQVKKIMLADVLQLSPLMSQHYSDIQCLFISWKTFQSLESILHIFVRASITVVLYEITPGLIPISVSMWRSSLNALKTMDKSPRQLWSDMPSFSIWQMSIIAGKWIPV